MTQRAIHPLQSLDYAALAALARAATPAATAPVLPDPWDTPEGISIPALRGPADLACASELASSPGLPPYLRGPYATMYTRRPWTIRQYAGFSTAEESNAFYRRNLAEGQKGLSIAFDLATHRGYDSDHPRVVGDVGMAGVAIDSILDMRILFESIPLDQISVSMTMNGAVLPIMALYIVAAEEQGVRTEQLSGTIQNDILKEFMVRNTYIYPPGPSLRIIGDIFSYTAAKAPALQLDLGVGVSHARGGGDRRHRARVYAGGRARVRAHGPGGGARGRRVRAADLVLLRDRYAPDDGGREAAGGAAALVGADAPRRRALAEVLGAAHPLSDLGLELGRARPVQQRRADGDRGARGGARGTQSLHTNAFDEALALPSVASARIARNTQIYWQEEAGICRVVDPLGGAYHLERLTYDLAEKAGSLIDEIEAMGGMARAIEAGLPKLRIEEAAARTQARIDSGAQAVIGVNRRRAPQEPEIRVLRVDNRAVREAQLARLAQLRRERDPAAVAAALAGADGLRGRGAWELARAGGGGRSREGDGGRDQRGAGGGLGPAQGGDPDALGGVRCGRAGPRGRAAAASADALVRRG
jgi:methylmalonyl-CoA mutase